MSLINDALKRASTKAPSSPPDLPQAVPVLQPAADHNRRGAVPVIGLAALALLLVVVFFWMRSQPAPTQAKAAPQPAAAPAQAPAAAAPQPQPLPANPLQRAAGVAQSVSAANQHGQAVADSIASTPPAPVQTAVAQPAPAQPAPQPQPVPLAAAPAPAPTTPSVAAPAEAPVLKLQAIFFRMNKPTVVINGKTLGRGDSINGATVLSIERNSVDLDVNGQRQTLTLK